MKTLVPIPNDISKGHCFLRLKTKKLNLRAQISAEQGRHTHFHDCPLAAHSQLHYLRYRLNRLGGSWWCLQRLIWLWGNGLLNWILNNWMCSILRSAIWNGWIQSNPSTSVALGLSGSQWAPNAGTLEHSCTYRVFPFVSSLQAAAVIKQTRRLINRCWFLAVWQHEVRDRGTGAVGVSWELSDRRLMVSVPTWQ